MHLIKFKFLRQEEIIMVMKIFSSSEFYMNENDDRSGNKIENFRFIGLTCLFPLSIQTGCRITKHKPPPSCNGHVM